MAKLTLSIPDELKKEMDSMSFANWSDIARTAIKERIIQFKIMESIASKSKLTEKDAFEFSKKINRGISERLRKEFGEK